MTVFTIGHSTRSLDELVELLRANDIELVVDVRTAPGSRRVPHFAKSSLGAQLPLRGIEYIHLPELGGLRKATSGSANAGWRNASFRAYADYMQTEAFLAGLNRLMAMANGRKLAIMCAEAVPWRCHRSLIADALTARGVEVREIIGWRPARLHTMTSFARIDGDRVTYPPPDDTPSVANSELAPFTASGSGPRRPPSVRAQSR